MAIKQCVSARLWTNHSFKKRMVMQHFFKKKWIQVMLGIIFIFTVIQFIQPQISNPVITADLRAPEPVKSVLRRSCYNCHSNETRLAWFDRIAPTSWLVAKDIKEGRTSANFSDWDKIPKDRQKGILFEALNQMEFGTMPVKYYALIHSTARPGPREINIFKSYLRTLFVDVRPDSVKLRTWNEQYNKWLKRIYASRPVPASLNGLNFNPRYKDWDVIGATVRDDNGTLKIILGNDIAVRAAKGGQTNPWPDGAVFAKLTWIQTLDSTNNIRCGEFKQIAFMDKDTRKYQSTAGWGFSQWDNGLDLATHGKNALFTTECVNCHRPMKNYDYVFTRPLLPGMVIKTQGSLITFLASRSEHTLSILYGNRTAAEFIRSHAGSIYPAGSELTLVTWNQQVDTHWFGGYIADTIIQVEKIYFRQTNSPAIEPAFEKYLGNTLVPAKTVAADEQKKRTAFITNLRPSVVP